jgi:serine/threonine protein kinase
VILMNSGDAAIRTPGLTAESDRADVSVVSSERPVAVTPQTARVPLPRSGSRPDELRLAGFDVVAELGRGARSTVYRVRRIGPADAARADSQVFSGASPREYALKILDLSLADSVETLIGFRREAALLACVDHPGLARVYEVGTVSGRPYLVMDLVTGRSLEVVLQAGAMAPEEVIALALDIVDPLAAAHRRGLVHRDLKPPNVMVLLTGREDATLAAVGTFAYCAPEQSGC